MIPQFQKLSDEERELLFKAPVLVSVLASCSFQQVNVKKRSDAVKLAHLRTFTAPPQLQPYYREVEKYFTKQFEEVEKAYFPFDDEKRNEMKKKISHVHEVIEKLPTGFGEALQKSLEGYAKHVKHSAHTVFQDIIFPITYSSFNG